MKNIADVNSDDILSQLNNLDYDNDDDLMLLDDEDIRPISNNSKDDDLADFYSDYKKEEKKEAKVEPKEDIDIYTEKTKVIPPITPAFEDKTIRIETPIVNVKSSNNINKSTNLSDVPSIDTYLNRKVEVSKPVEKTYSMPVKDEAPKPIVNSSKSAIPTFMEKREVTPSLSQTKITSTTNVVKSTPIISSSNNTSDNEIKDINQLFNKVTNNVKGASEIVNKNAEIKKKIEAKFEELRKMQEEHEYNKKRDYDEINAYKEEVYSKLQQKKSDMERDLNNLRANQEKFEKEKKSFEEYKNSSLSNLNKLEKELKDSYENRSKNIEQVEIGLVRRKEQLDIEKANIAKEREQVQKEKDELAKNLLQFNKLVSEFTQGIDDFG